MRDNKFSNQKAPKKIIWKSKKDFSSDCGEEEAIEAYFHLNMLPLQKWVLFDNTENEF